MGNATMLRAGLITLSVGLGVACLATVVWPSDPAKIPEGGVPGSATDLVGAPGTAGSGRTGATRETVAGHVAQLRGRCVAEESGGLLEATAWRWRRLSSVALPGVAPESHRDAGGEFALPLPAERGRITIRVDAPGRVPLTCRLTLRPETDIDLGTLTMRAGSAVRGVLRDAAGRPFEGARLRLHARVPSYFTGRMFEVHAATVTTGVDGAFEIPDPVASGAYHVILTDAPPLVSDATIRVDANDADTVLDLVCAVTSAADQIRGRARNSRGNPAPRVVVEVTRKDRRGYRFSTLTRADGTFVLFRPPNLPRDESVMVSVSSFEGGEAHERTPCAWGRTDLDLVLRPANRLRVEVVEAATGEPVRDFAVRCFPTSGAWRRPTVTENTGRERGVAWIPGVGSGHHLIVVYPRGAWAASCVATLPLSCHVPAGEDGYLRVELQDKGSVEVVATYADGKAVEDSVVELFWLYGRDRLDGRMPSNDLATLFENGSGRSAYAARLARARTDATGSVRLAWSPSDTRLTLRITGAHTAFQQDDFVIERAGQTLRVVVEKGGSLRGRLTPDTHLKFVHFLTRAEWDRLAFLRQHESAATADRYWSLLASGFVLVEHGGEGRRLPWQASRRFPVGEDGSFAIDGIPAGRWSVYLDRRTPQGTFARSARSLARLHFANGEERVDNFDLRGLVEPGVVSGELQHNGVPLGNVIVRATWRARDTGLVVAGKTRTNGAGSFRIGGLPPRQYQLDVYLGDSSIPFGDPFELAARQRLARAYTLRTSLVRLELRDAKGPLVQRRVEVVGVGTAGKGLRWRRRTDASGVLVLSHVPPGKYRLAKSDSPAIVVRPGIIEQTFKRRL
jgi:hypothetical protein